MQWFILQEEGFILSELAKFQNKDADPEYQVAPKDDELADGQNEIVGDYLYALEEVILCPDTNFQCKLGKSIIIFDWNELKLKDKTNFEGLFVWVPKKCFAIWQKMVVLCISNVQ